jgi:ubiquinone/menaquinone biosynthesis C-methylase UbiE
MSYLTAFFYDRFMAGTERACLQAWRRELLLDVKGEVLEVGAGTGANIALYPASVTRLVLAEPDRHMRRQLEDKARTSAMSNITVAGDAAEQISAADESFDFVVTSLVCCSLTDLDAGLREIKRVLRTGGGLVFLEHVAAAEGSGRRRWQDRINPLWRTVMGNCHLNRETEQAMVSAGFRINRIKRESMRKAIPIVRPTIRGIAEKS